MHETKSSLFFVKKENKYKNIKQIIDAKTTVFQEYSSKSLI